MGWGCSSVGRASDRHAADTGSSSPVRQRIFLSVSFQCRLSYGVRAHPCAIAFICICVKDPAVPVRVRSILDTLKHPACTAGWVARLSQLAFPGEGNPSLKWEISHWDYTVIKSEKNKVPCKPAFFFLSITQVETPVLRTMVAVLCKSSTLTKSFLSTGVSTGQP